MKFNLFEQQIAERMSLDIRYFCDDVAGKRSVPSSKHCRKALTKLPKALSNMISTSSIGGIVLFAENVQNTEQVVTLTHDIQQAALKSPQAKPLIISIDQEGGRVARFAKMTGFAGNMAIGASYKQHGTHFSTQVNRVIAKELHTLGINNNYAPVIDVNTNAKNPVINTRSYGESPEQVADLGISAVKAIQAEGVMSTLKHFPGHGDTHVDSHLGLPRVDHDRAMIDKVDLLPFSRAISQANPAMIMTAHIQYPALDSSVFVSKNGESLIRPATMSRKILTDLLRNKMAFEGIIATDALDMGGVTHFFTDVEAVVETFIAGADLAVMPFKVRTPDDIEAFYQFIKTVAQVLSARIEKGEYEMAEFEQSVTRLNHYKKQYIKLTPVALSDKVKMAKTIIANDNHLAIEQALADAAVIVLKNTEVLPLASKQVKHIHVLVASQQEFSAITYAIDKALNHSLSKDEKNHVTISHHVADSTTPLSEANVLLANADLFISTVDIKTASLVDLGGMDDLTPSYGSTSENKKKMTYSTLLKQQLTYANTINKPSVLIAKGSPFLIKEYSDLAGAVLLNFDDRVYQWQDEQMISPGFNASLAVTFNEYKNVAELPVTLN